MIVDFLSLFSKRSIFSTLGLTLLVGLTSWIAVKSTDSYKFTENPPKDFIANQGYGFEYKQYRPSGTIAYKGNAESVVRLENGQSKMQQLAIKIYPQNSASRPWHVNATKAKSFKKTKVIHLSEQVTIKHPGNSKQSKPALKITMPKASVFPEKNYAETDSPVKLIEQDSPNVLTGVGLKAWFKPLKIKLLSQVRGFYNQKRTKLNDDENTSFFNDNKQAHQGPVTICSKRLTYDQNNSHVVYSGNVTLFQITGMNLLCQKRGGAFPEQVSNKLANKRIWINPDHKSFRTLSKQELAIAKKICHKKQQCRFLHGRRLVIKLNPTTNKVVKIELQSLQTKNHVQYYAIPSKKSKKSEQKPKPIYATGNKIIYNKAEHTLVIRGNAQLKRAGSVFEGKKVSYNIKTGVASVPETSERAQMVIDKEKIKSSKDQ